MGRECKQIRIPPPVTLRATGGQIASKQVFRKECLANEFVFAGQGADAYGHADASRGHFIQPLVGQAGTTEIVVGAENEVGGAQVDASEVRGDDLLGIAGHPGETEADGQLG